MKPKNVGDSAKQYEDLIADSHHQDYVLQLYVTGATPQSARAIANIRKICEKYLEGYYRLDVIDLYQQPQLAKDEQLIAAPTLIKRLPLPVRRMLGDMSKMDRVLAALGLLKS